MDSGKEERVRTWRRRGNQKTEVGLSHRNKFQEKSIIHSVNSCQGEKQVEGYWKLWDNNDKYLKVLMIGQELF